MNEWKFRPWTVDEYLDQMVDRKKARDYKSWSEMWEDSKADENSTIFETFTKANEYNCCDEPRNKRNRRKLDPHLIDARPRFITCPKREFFAYSCTVNKALLNWIKMIFPTVVTGKTVQEYEEHFNVSQFLRAGGGIDGGSHDSHQGYRIFRAVDDPILENVLE